MIFESTTVDSGTVAK